MATVQKSQFAAQKNEARNAAAAKATTAILPDRIAARAYEIWQANGRPVGRDLDHWFQAERELRASQVARTTHR
jgi:hypothetical protein